MRDEQDRVVTEQRILAELGLFLGQSVLGPKIMEELSSTGARRTLLVRIPSDAAGEDRPTDFLAAAFARRPWEIARTEENGRTLMDRNVIVRVVADEMPEPHRAVLEAAEKVENGDTPLKVLLVFAEAPGSRPLAMRLEREQVRDLFCSDILPKKNVQLDILCHGVTREVLKEQVRAANGYHMVHWSGHGYHNTLELRGENGGKDWLTGEELAALFEDAGGFIPQFVFLSACLSGAFVDVKDWASLRAAMLGEKPDEKRARDTGLDQVLKDETGYTGTAMAMLKSGVPQVAAMRYEVGDDYARELARRFYKRYLADAGEPETAEALAVARRELLDDDTEAELLGPVNHATPILFGRGGRFLSPKAVRSQQMKTLRPRPQPVLPSGNRELDTPDNFVGRGEILADLQARWLAAPDTPVALIQGMAGLGKTALTAEMLHLWHPRFDWVAAFQAKPVPLTLDDFFGQMDARLTLCSRAYLDRCETAPNQRIYLEPGQPLKGPARYGQMRVNLLEALWEEAILIILDNFEPCLEDVIRDGTCRCEEPEWDETLEYLCRELPGTRSRLVVTSRLRPAALNDNALWVPLGPLPIGEAGLFVRSHPDLRALLHSGEDGERRVRDLLDISRGHPLILDRLAALARDPEALEQAMAKLRTEGFSAFPDVYAPTKMTETDRENEGAYLEDAAVKSVDALVARLSPHARRLLWIVTLANEPPAEKLVEAVWGGKSAEDEALSQFRSLLKMADMLPDDKKAELEGLAGKIPPELREQAPGQETQIDALLKPLAEKLGAPGQS